MNRHRVARWASFAHAVLVSLAVGLLWPGLGLAQSALPNFVGLYRGFTQPDDLTPGRTELIIDRQDEGGDFFGHWAFNILPFIEQDNLFVQGKVLDVQGSFKLRGTSPAGIISATGTFQPVLGDRAGDQGAALVIADFKFTPATGGRLFHGMTHLLRALPPDPVMPLLIGAWVGTSTSDLTGRQETLALDITSQDGGFFEGFEIVGGIVPCVIVGTIGVTGHFVIIGAGDAGRVLEGGRFLPPPDDGLTGTFFRTGGATGPVDLGTFTLDRVVR